MKSSNIGGQAVMEGVMMMNKDHYSVAVRRPDGEIEVKVEQHKPLTKHKGLLKVPILRGVFSFADSMIVGMSSLMYSASFYEDEEEDDDDDSFDDDKLTEESYRTTFETNPDDLNLEAEDVADDDY